MYIYIYIYPFYIPIVSPICRIEIPMISMSLGPGKPVTWPHWLRIGWKPCPGLRRDERSRMGCLAP